MTDILHISDRERAKDAMIRTLESARDEMAKLRQTRLIRPTDGKDSRTTEGE